MQTDDTRRDTARPWTHRAPAVRAALLLALVCGWGCGEQAPEPVPQLRPVRTEAVVASGGVQRVTLAGVAQAGVESRISFRVAGTVRGVAVKLGDSVEAGQVLARLDPTDYELKVEEAQAALAQGQAALRRAVADYDRARSLYENNSVAKGELDAARANAESAQAQVAAGSKQLQQAEQQLGYTVLRSPLAGAVAAVEVEVNETVSGGSPVFLLTSVAQPEVQVAVPEILIAQVRVGQPVSVVLDALPGVELAATVSEVAVAATGSTSTFSVTARFDSADDRIRSGMAADVTFRFVEPGAQTRTFVPMVAVGEDASGRYVYVLEDRGDGTGQVRRRGVEVGELRQNGLELTSGVEVGERVVTAGVRRLSDGLEVKVLDDGEAAP